MHATHKRNPLLMTYNMNGRPIEVTASHTYLGIGINNKLSWAEHISNTVSKANKVLGLSYHNLYTCAPFVKETAYKSLVRPRLEYFSSIWDPYHQDYKNKLELVQHRAARFVSKDFRCQSHVFDMAMDIYIDIGLVVRMSVSGYRGRLFKFRHQYVVSLSKTLYLHCFSRLSCKMSTRWG